VIRETSDPLGVGKISVRISKKTREETGRTSDYLVLSTERLLPHPPISLEFMILSDKEDCDKGIVVSYSLDDDVVRVQMDEDGVERDIPGSQLYPKDLFHELFDSLDETFEMSEMGNEGCDKQNFHDAISHWKNALSLVEQVFVEFYAVNLVYGAGIFAAIFKFAACALVGRFKLLRKLGDLLLNLNRIKEGVSFYRAGFFLYNEKTIGLLDCLKDSNMTCASANDGLLEISLIFTGFGKGLLRWRDNFEIGDPPVGTVAQMAVRFAKNADNLQAEVMAINFLIGYTFTSQGRVPNDESERKFKEIVVGLCEDVIKRLDVCIASDCTLFDYEGRRMEVLGNLKILVGDMEGINKF
jgi:hypothetical protein